VARACSGFADTVSAEKWGLFNDRITAARRTLEATPESAQQDPVWWRVFLRIARAQEGTNYEFDQALGTAKSLKPTFWRYDVSRAESLLPRWYGKPGDWEAYAEQAAARPDGLGDEVYARIVMALRGYYGNIFRETKASWPKTRAGLERMLQLYPESLDILSEAALLAVHAGDRAMAKSLFDRLGERYMPSVWQKPEYLIQCRNWAGAAELTR
jgi:hypothetical protein